MADFRPAPVKHAINEKKLQLHARNASGKDSTLKFNVVKNYPRIDVYTNDDNDPKNKEPIRAAMDQPTFYLFLSILEAAINAPGEIEHTIENKNFTFFGGKRSEKPEVISRTTVGKDSDGIIFITVSAKNRPKIKFQVIPGVWNYLIDSSGQTLGAPLASKLMAKAWHNMLTQMIGSYLIFNYELVEAPQPANGGGNKWGGNGGGNSRPAAPDVNSDDLPF